jgi:large subunit ribosomal protein L15
MDLAHLKYAAKSRKKKKRVGCGEGSGHGGTSTQGHKGQNARSGGGVRPWFEGGQMPLQRRLPKRGFHNLFRKEFQVVNLGDLERVEKEPQITPDVLFQNGLIRKKNEPVKILGSGELKKAIKVHAHAFSASAKERIEKAGGTATVLPRV